MPEPISNTKANNVDWPLLRIELAKLASTILSADSRICRFSLSNVAGVRDLAADDEIMFDFGDKEYFSVRVNRRGVIVPGNKQYVMCQAVILDNAHDMVVAFDKFKTLFGDELSEVEGDRPPHYYIIYQALRRWWGPTVSFGYSLAVCETVRGIVIAHSGVEPKMLDDSLHTLAKTMRMMSEGETEVACEPINLLASLQDFDPVPICSYEASQDEVDLHVINHLSEFVDMAYMLPESVREKVKCQLHSSQV